MMAALIEAMGAGKQPIGTGYPKSNDRANGHKRMSSVLALLLAKPIGSLSQVCGS